MVVIIIDSIEFKMTNNAWINNGLIRLIIELEKKFDDEVSIIRKNNSVVFSSQTDNPIEYYLNEIIYYLAAFGTYNFSQVFKNLNKHLNCSFAPPSLYPKNPKDIKKKYNVPKEFRDQIKKFDNHIDIASKNQVWKMRLSYINNSSNYFDLGLNFKESIEFSKLTQNDEKNNVCPVCGSISKNMINIKQSFNPLTNEHHNNKLDGFGNLRLKNKFCPKCNFLSLISVFDKYIPFYMMDLKNVFLALPNIYNIEILEKILSNLSLNSQFIDFSSVNVTKYNKNILNFTNLESTSSAMLSLLNNIQNNFSKEQVGDIFQMLSTIELMEIVDWIFIKKGSFSINRIKANNNVYKILKPQLDKNDGKMYLVNDILNRNNFDGFSMYKIEKFFKSLLELDDKSLSKSLFEMVKSDVKFFNIYYFKELFLNQIFGEIFMLDEEFKKTCKSISETIGKSFYQDISLLSKFAYATDDKMFKEYIEEAFFLMAKKAISDQDIAYHCNKELEIFFNGLNETNFKETKSYFVSFMSSSALYNKYMNKQED